jgi:hypothetical protein
MPHNHDTLHRHQARKAFEWPTPDDIVSALAAPFEEREPSAERKTLTSVVYVTLKPTFTGEVGGYITGDGTQIKTDSTPESTKKANTAKDTKTVSEKTEKKTSTVVPKVSSTASTKTPSAILSPTKSLASTDGLVFASQSSSSSSTSASATSTSGSSTLSQDSTTTPTPMSGGAKAGIAIGVIGGIGAILLLVFFFFRMRKKAAERERSDDEKYNATSSGENPFADGRAASTRTTATAPRLSLRPVTGLFGDRRTSRGNALQMASNGGSDGAAGAMTPQSSAWGARPGDNPNNRDNPFGNHAETVDPVNAAGPTTVDGVSASGDLMSGPGPAMAAGAVVGGAAVGLKRGASKRGNGPVPFDFTRNNPNQGAAALASPAGTDYSMNEASGTPAQTNGGAVIAAAGGPQNSAVHRVQLDFKPSMDDELELRAGQLIRLLHEYDDGWVSLQSFRTRSKLTFNRLFASVLIAQCRVLSHVPACQLAQSSLVQ